MYIMFGLNAYQTTLVINNSVHVHTVGMLGCVYCSPHPPSSNIHYFILCAHHTHTQTQKRTHMNGFAFMNIQESANNKKKFIGHEWDSGEGGGNDHK